MKQELASLDVKFLVSELQALSGARMEKFYQKDREVHILLHVPQKGTHTLVLGAGKMFLTKKRFEYAKMPPTFAMTLRKYLGGKKISAIAQHDFDRVVAVETETHKLIAELFRNGNIVLTDNDYGIWSVLERQAWKDRTIKVREKYIFPAHRHMKETLSKIRESGKQAVVFLASDLSFGGEYAEELLSRAKIDKAKNCKTLSEKEISAISCEIERIFDEKPAPYVVREGGEIVDFAPFPMERHKGRAKEEKACFNEAVAEYFEALLQKLAERHDFSGESAGGTKAAAAEKAEKTKAGKFDIRLNQQVSALETIRKEAEIAKKTGDMIYSNFDFFTRAIQEKEKHKINPKEKTITVDFEGEKIVIFYNEPISKSAQKYYEKSKRLKEKIARLEREIGKTKKEMEAHKEVFEERKVALPAKETKREWYHKFRWFFTSGGFLCVCGRDADTNEELIKKRMEKTDMVLHADITGSPFGLLKTRGKPADEKSIKEALEFVAAYSRAWQAGVGVVDAYWVFPGQVSKKAPAGEYISKGSFMIYGKKNIFRAELRLAIGIKNGEAVAGAVSSVPKPYAVIKPGRTEAKELAESVRAHIISRSPKEAKARVEKVPIADIARLIPFGRGQLGI